MPKVTAYIASPFGGGRGELVELAQLGNCPVAQRRACEVNEAQLPVQAALLAGQDGDLEDRVGPACISDLPFDSSNF